MVTARFPILRTPSELSVKRIPVTTTSFVPLSMTFLAICSTIVSRCFSSVICSIIRNSVPDRKQSSVRFGVMISACAASAFIMLRKSGVHMPNLLPSSPMIGSTSRNVFFP